MKRMLSYYVLALQKNFMIFCNERLQEMNLSQGLLYFVLYIGKNAHCAPGRLAKELHFDSGHTTRCIDKLEELGIVQREKSVHDRRGCELCLSEKGKEVYLKADSLFGEWDDEVVSKLSVEESAELHRILCKLSLF